MATDRAKQWRAACWLLALTLGGRAIAADVPTRPGNNAWSAPTARPTARELSFTNGGAHFSGTLLLPPGRPSSPVVIVYHSAGDALRTAALYRHLKEMLPALGIGVFVYDRRGSGASTGPSAKGSFELLADDGIAARRMLERVAGVDPARIGYWGLSQGGWLAVLAATRDPRCAFAIAVSAPMVTADVQMRFAIANILRIRGYDRAAIDQAVATRRGVDDFMRGRATRAEAQRRLDAAATQPWFDSIYMKRTFDDPATSSWAREMRNDPLETIAAAKVPIMVIYGDGDPWVPVDISMQRLAALHKANIHPHVVMGADHAMMTSATPLVQVDPEALTQQSPESPEYFAVMARWLTAKNIAAKP